MLGLMSAFDRKQTSRVVAVRRALGKTRSVIEQFFRSGISHERREAVPRLVFSVDFYALMACLSLFAVAGRADDVASELARSLSLSLGVMQKSRLERGTTRRAALLVLPQMRVHKRPRRMISSEYFTGSDVCFRPKR
jgi:hypothetical protein